MVDGAKQDDSNEGDPSEASGSGEATAEKKFDVGRLARQELARKKFKRR